MCIRDSGVETGIIRRLPHGAYIELHQPLGGPIPLSYQGAPLPKRMNKLGSGGSPGSGGLLLADPVTEDSALREAGRRAHQRALAALRDANR